MPCQANQDFAAFVAGIWPDARAAEVSRATFDRAFQGVTPDMSLPDLLLPGKTQRDVKGQAEFVRPPQDYLNKAQLTRLADQGKTFLTDYKVWLDKIERDIGVERHVLLGIWGRETAFGTYKLPHYAIKVLATQAYTGRRKEMFRNELVQGLLMLERGVITIERLKSSWAGAIGLPQFMPSEYFDLAYDLDGDGKKDIWNSVPDALASAANQLKAKGWRRGLTWGYEIELSPNVDCSFEGPGEARPLSEWVRLGLKRTQGRPFPQNALNESVYLMMPGGTHGPGFLVTENFTAIKRYNQSDLYAVFVGHLADRIAGGGDFATPWRDITQLPAGDIEDAQLALQKLGYAIEKIDGKAGSNTRRQLGLYQKKSSMQVDCWLNSSTLGKLRGVADNR
jgi:lytic murein transglycosylase